MNDSQRISNTKASVKAFDRVRRISNGQSCGDSWISDDKECKVGSSGTAGYKNPHEAFVSMEKEPADKDYPTTQRDRFSKNGQFKFNPTKNGSGTVEWKLNQVYNENQKPFAAAKAKEVETWLNEHHSNINTNHGVVEMTEPWKVRIAWTNQGNYGWGAKDGRIYASNSYKTKIK